MLNLNKYNILRKIKIHYANYEVQELNNMQFE